MAYQLHIPPCIHSPHHPLHFPPHSKPLRIQIEGPTVSIQKLFPEKIRWVTTDGFRTEFPQPAGPKLAALAYRTIYGCEPTTEDDDDGDLVVRDEYLGWIIDPKPISQFDYYGITFDHNIPPNDSNPETLQINILETEHDDGAYANSTLQFHVDAAAYTARSHILAVPRCCQKRKGTTDRKRINTGVQIRQAQMDGVQWDVVESATQ